jgi:flagellar protein FliS
MNYSAAQRYKQIGNYSSTAYADPHQLINLLMQGALDKIAVARGAIENKDIAIKGECIGKAIAIIDGLRSSLDKDKGPDIANNLDDLYDYMQRRLLEGSLKNDIAMLDEVCSLINEIKTAWDAIPMDIRQTYAARMQ